MSDDIVERLQRAEQMNEGRGCGLFKAAADEIIRLRDQLDLSRANLDEMDCDMRDGRYCAHHEHKCFNWVFALSPRVHIPKVGI